MTAAIIFTSITWIVFFATMNREPSSDYGVNIIPALQAGAAIIATLVIWLIYFAMT